jgi:hypothetical protein
VSAVTFPLARADDAVKRAAILRTYAADVEALYDHQ